MTQTQQNFATTAKQVSSIEGMVADGMKTGADRQSQHSLEAERMGLRKSQEGAYSDANGQSANALHGRSDSMVQKLLQKAKQASAEKAAQAKAEADAELAVPAALIGASAVAPGCCG